MNETCRMMDIRTHSDHRGCLSVVEGDRDIPFPIRRMYYLYDVPKDRHRGAHAHRRLHQLLIAVTGSLRVQLDDGRRVQSFNLDRSDRGLYIPPMMWRELADFAPGTVCCVLASEVYDPEEYLHDYRSFKRLVESGSSQ